MTFDKAYFDAGISRIGTNCVKWDGMLEESKLAVLRGLVLWPGCTAV